MTKTTQIVLLTTLSAAIGIGYHIYRYVSKTRITLSRQARVNHEAGRIEDNERVAVDCVEKVVSDDEQLHNKVTRKLRRHYLRGLVQGLKVEFGHMQATKLNIKVVRHAATRMMTQHGVRHAHQFQLMERLIPLVFTLTDVELEMDRSIDDLNRPLYVPKWLRWLMGHDQFIDRACHETVD